MAIAIVDTIIAEADSAVAVTTASHSIAAGNAAALMMASNGISGTDHTVSVTGSHSFTQRVLLSDGSGQPGTAGGFSINNSPGTTGTTTVTRSGGAFDLGISVTITELSGAETTFSGATGSASSASGTASTGITVANADSFVFGAASDWVPRGAFTAGTGETLDNTHDPGVYDGGQWHSTSTVGAGAYTSDAAGSATRQFNCVAMEMSPAAGGGGVANAGRRTLLGVGV